VNRPYVELRELQPGARFRFLAFPDQVATLVEKSSGRAMIRYERKREPKTRTFEARDRNGQKETRTVTVNRDNDLEPCALGAQVVPVGEAGR
jgi:hypothetical protein